MSTSFHPQTDGASECAIQSVTQILQSVVTSDQTDWVDHLPMVEFAINSSASASTGYAPFELTYGYLPSIFKGWDAHDAAPPGVLDFACHACYHLMLAHDAIVGSHIMQTHQANRHCRQNDDITTDTVVYVSTENLSLPRALAEKLLPKFLGPYKVLAHHPETSSYTLELPLQHCIYPTFHVSKFRPHESNDDTFIVSPQGNPTSI